VRKTIHGIGYNDAAFGFDSLTCAVMSTIDRQSVDIAQGVDTGGAGDQGMMFGYASDETPELMPLPIQLAHALTQRLARLRKNGTLPWLRPDGKAQVSVIYDDGRPIAVDTVVAVLREQTARGVPVLFSSHQLDVVERLCDDLVIIGDGAILTAGRREELRAAYALPRYEIRVDGDAGWLRDQPGVTMVDLDGPRAVFDLAAGFEDQSVLRAALDRGPVRVFAPIAPSLAEIFREVAR